MNIKIKIAGIMLSFIFLFSLFTGCTSTDGKKLSQAIINSTNIKSMQSKSKISLNIETKRTDLKKQHKQLINLINNADLYLKSKSDIENTKTYVNGYTTINNIKYSGRLYSNGEKSWLKVPLEPNYILFDPQKLTDFDQKTYEQNIKINNQINSIAKEYFRDYIKQYKYNFKNITNKGKSIIETPEGQKEITTIEVKLDTKQFIDFLNYTLENMQDSEILKNYFKSVIRISYKQNSSSFEGKTIEEVMKDFNKYYNRFKLYLDIYSTQLSLYKDRITEFFEVGSEGIVFSFGLDNENNIVKMDMVIDLIFKQKANKQTNVLLKCNETIYNINNTTVTIPEISKEKTISFNEYLKTNKVLKKSPIGKELGINKKHVMLKIGNGQAYANGKKIKLDVKPYIKKGTTLVPVRFVAESLGAQVSWRGEDRSVIYKDGSKVIRMQINNKTAYTNNSPVQMPIAPEIKNGRAMVPLRFVSEQFGAVVKWDGQNQTITIEK